jgi:hypothetical protein
VAAVAKELKATKNALDKARDRKAAVSAEMAALKAAAKRLTAYTKPLLLQTRCLINQQRKEKKRKLAR